MKYNLIDKLYKPGGKDLENRLVFGFLYGFLRLSDYTFFVYNFICDILSLSKYGKLFDAPSISNTIRIAN